MKRYLGLIASVALPLLAQAHPLAIANQTPYTLSFKVNHLCAQEFGSLYRNDIKTISSKTLNRVCSNYKSPCKIMAYEGKNCSGNAIGGMKYLSAHDIVVIGIADDVAVTGTDTSLFFTAPIKKK